MPIMNFAHSLKLDKRSNTVLFDDNPEEQAKVLKRLKTNRLFKLLNIYQTRFERGEAMGLYTPIAGTTNTTAGETREPKNALAPNVEYHCQQLNIDAYIHKPISKNRFKNAIEKAVKKKRMHPPLKISIMDGKNRTNFYFNNPEEIENEWLNS